MKAKKHSFKAADPRSAVMHMAGKWELSASVRNLLFHSHSSIVCLLSWLRRWRVTFPQSLKDKAISMFVEGN